MNENVNPDFVREQVGHQDLQTTQNSYVFATETPADQITRIEDALKL